MYIDTSYVTGDSYVSERRDEYVRGMKLMHKITPWLYVVTGAVGAAYAQSGSRWWLVAMLFCCLLIVLRSIEMTKHEQMFVLGSLENRARTLEARTEQISAIQDRRDKQDRRGSDSY